MPGERPAPTPGQWVIIRFSWYDPDAERWEPPRYVTALVESVYADGRCILRSEGGARWRTTRDGTVQHVPDGWRAHLVRCGRDRQPVTAADQESAWRLARDAAERRIGWGVPDAP